MGSDRVSNAEIGSVGMRLRRGGFPDALSLGALLLVLGVSMGCGGKLPDDLGATSGQLAACPESPNCVSSFATDDGHAIDAFALTSSAAEAWAGLEAVLAETPRVEIVARSPGYLHAVFTTSLMRYRDDVEFLQRPAVEEIAVRSASRVGYGDMGANRDRIETIRATLSARGLVASGTED